MRGRWVLAVLVLVVWVGVIQAQDTPTPTPTATETPTLTLTATATETPTATATSTATETPTPTASPSPSVTVSPTSTATETATATADWTPVVATVVVTSPPIVLTAPPQVVIITPPPVVIPATAIPPTVVPPTAAPASSAGQSVPPTAQTPFYGWQRYQSIHLVAVIGLWPIRDDASASARQYRSSQQPNALARYPFTGDGVQVGYREHPDGCAFDILIDDVLIETRNSFADSPRWVVTDPYFLPSGYHLLDIRSRANRSGVCSVDIDYLEVFTGPPQPNGGNTNTTGNIPPTTDAIPIQRVTLLSAPPTPAPTATVIPASVVTLQVQVAYDANASDSADLNEGVQGVSVRVVSATTGALLTGGFTDAQGGLRLQVVTREPVVAHLPLLGRTLNVRPTNGAAITQSWTVLLPPANQPAVIP